MNKSDLILEGKWCPYCDLATELRERRRDASVLRIYMCPRCKASVRCHPGTERGMGSVASPELRRLRLIAHYWFDGLWKRKFKRSRYNSYSWLSLRMHLNKNMVHFGLFREDECLNAISQCKEYIRKRSSKCYEEMLKVESEKFGQSDE